jgi:hypothetical protein
MPPPLPVQSHVVAALRHSPNPALRKLSVDETETTVVILGSVPSYYLKQLAQETVKPHLGGRSLLNRVMVIRSAQPVPSN